MSRPSSMGRVGHFGTGCERSAQVRRRPRKSAPALEFLESRRLLAATGGGAATEGDGPRVVAVQRFGVHNQATSLVIQFNQALDPARAQDLNNYRLRNFKSRAVGIGSAAYDPATNSVLLQPRQLINLHRSAQLLVVGTAPGGLTNTAGVLLDGANTGHPGSSFSTLLTRKNLAGPPVQGATPHAAAVVDAALRTWGNGTAHAKP
jgi:hypothetical protein